MDYIKSYLLRYLAPAVDVGEDQPELPVLLHHVPPLPPPPPPPPRPSPLCCADHCLSFSGSFPWSPNVNIGQCAAIWSSLPDRPSATEQLLATAAPPATKGEVSPVLDKQSKWHQWNLYRPQATRRASRCFVSIKFPQTPPPGAPCSPASTARQGARGRKQRRL